MKIQTDGFVVIGELLNNERRPCPICREIPDRVRVELLGPEPSEVPACLSVPDKTLTLLYRLCPRCYEAKPDAWIIRLLVLARVTTIAEDRSRS
jgi:hypothetical protein